MRISIRRKLFYSHFVAVLLVSGSVGTYFYFTAVDSLFRSLQLRLQYSAGLLGRALDAGRLDGIGTTEDVAEPAYIDSLSLLRDFQQANQDVAFIYVMRREGQRVLFVVDSDPSPRQALPGQEYPNPPATLLRGFQGQAADDEVTADEWGYFLSGYAPLKNGGGRYLVGIDMRADEVHRKLQRIRVSGVVSLAVSVVLAYLFSLLLAARITRPIRLFVGRTAEISGGVLAGRVEVRTGDELEELGNAFNTMTERLATSRLETEQALRRVSEARDQLELRVAERTSSLTEANQLLQHEIEVRTRAEEALARAASTDYLTGLANRPALLSMLDREAERFRRSQRPFSLLLVDLDRFKTVNDTLGHDAGDRVLIQVAQLLCQGVRAHDVIARWGGDELLLFLPETARDGAVQLAERLRGVVGNTPLDAGGATVALTLSIGASTIFQGMSVTECIRRADLALYQAKSEGRNRVVFAE
jgi:diguanylate cyclase (GGDEF)-like protein